MVGQQGEEEWLTEHGRLQETGTTYVPPTGALLRLSDAGIGQSTEIVHAFLGSPMRSRPTLPVGGEALPNVSEATPPALVLRHLHESRPDFASEAMHQFRMAWPLMLASLMQLLITMASYAFVGRLGQLALASASIATSFANVLGNVVLQGMASGLETLCGQAYGGGAPGLLGLYLQRGLVILGATALPLACLWWFAEPLLLFAGQEPAIAAHAGLYLRYLIPCLAANVGIQCLERFLQAQGKTQPLALSAAVAALVHVPLTWLLVFGLQWGFVGAPIALSISFCINLGLLLIYVAIPGAVGDCWEGFSLSAFRGLYHFMSLALPSLLMLSLYYWSYELALLMTGLLPDPDLQVSTFAIIGSVGYIVYVIPYGFGIAVSIRVSNELGASRPEEAKHAACVATVVGIAMIAGLDLLLYLLRGSWASAFTTAQPVIDSVSALVPLGLIMMTVDCFNAVFAGVVRGCGHQQLAMVANFVGYYLLGLPLGITLGFHGRLGVIGMLVGLTAGSTFQCLSLIAISISTSWEAASQTAQGRMRTALLHPKEGEAEC